MNDIVQASYRVTKMLLKPNPWVLVTSSNGVTDIVQGRVTTTTMTGAGRLVLTDRKQITSGV